ncbi:hypothetical protein [Mediterranea massiliensis]|uniref:hypothetical protein n=1 Tax=Mediterranea massiliensis TaxID=1841865 RepID=UPI0023F137FA|nr:hypothetical protein [Mediterranea massiliensis]
MKKLLLLFSILLLALPIQSQKSFTGGALPQGKTISSKEFQTYKQAKAETLAWKRAHYRLVLVEVLPYMSLRKATNDELLAFCKGEAVLVNDQKEEVYVTQITLKIFNGDLEGILRKKDFEARLKRFIEFIDRWYSTPPPLKPRPNDTQAVKDSLNREAKKNLIEKDNRLKVFQRDFGKKGREIAEEIYNLKRRARIKE